MIQDVVVSLHATPAIIRLRSKDKPAYKEAVQRVWEICGVEDPKAFKPKSTHVVFVCVAAGVVLGVGVISHNRDNSRTMRADAVLPAYRGFGIHKSLIRERLDHATVNGIKTGVMVNACVSCPIAAHNYLSLDFKYTWKIELYNGLEYHKVEWNSDVARQHT